MSDELTEARERTKKIAAEFHEKGDATGWFEELYSQAGGDNAMIPWADLEPNPFFVRFAERTNLRGDGRKALVVGCGLGDDARFLRDAGFRVTAFDISPTAIEWAKKLYGEDGIVFVTADLFDPPGDWANAFDFVLEIYTIQPLPLEIRPKVVDAITGFVKPLGRLVIVTRGREDDETPAELPWPVSRKDLSRLDLHGMRQISFDTEDGTEEPPIPRFIIEYEKKA